METVAKKIMAYEDMTQNAPFFLPSICGYLLLLLG
jgi:hypothetical protein